MGNMDMTVTTEREELEKIFVDTYSCYSSPHPGTLKDRIMEWHSRHRVKVSREQVEKFFNETMTYRSIWQMQLKDDKEFRIVLPEFLDNLLSLLNGEKVWCEHIEWYDNSPMGNVGWHFGRSDAGWYRPARFDDWTLCPICGKERPKDG